MNSSCARLPIISFLIRTPGTNVFLHSNFVSCLLNDLFGIQSRSGCLCAGPYGQHVMGITPEAVGWQQRTTRVILT